MNGLNVIVACILFASVDEPEQTKTPAYPNPRSYNHPFKVTQSYDKFRDDTRLMLDLKTVFAEGKDKLSLQVIRHSPGEKRSPGSLSFYFCNEGEDGWRYLKYRSVVFLVDGERWVFEPEHDGDVKSGYVLEHLFVTISEDRLLKLANAKVAEIKVGADDFSLAADALVAIEDFASLIKHHDAPLPAARREADGAAEAERLSRAIDERLRKKAAKQASIPAQARINSAKAFEKDGKATLAIKYYREVVKEFPGTPQAKEAESRLKVLVK